MKQWEAFFKRYQLISRITKLMTFLAIAFVLICLVCCMVYSELSAAEDYAAALIGIADEQTVCFSKGCDMCRKTDCAFRRI